MTTETKTELEVRSESMVGFAQDLVVDSDETCQSAADWVNSLKPIEAEIRKMYDDPIHKANEAHKSLVKAKRGYMDKITEARVEANRKIGGWEAEKERKRQEEIRKAREIREREEAEAREREEKARREQEERERKERIAAQEREAERKAEEDRRLEKARKEEEAGNAAAAEQIIQDQIAEDKRKKDEEDRLESERIEREGRDRIERERKEKEIRDRQDQEARTRREASQVKKTEGITMKKRWTAEVFDLKALCRGIADGEAPASFVKANQVILDSIARSEKDGLKIPGVRAVSRDEVARSRR